MSIVQNHSTSGMAAIRQARNRVCRQNAWVRVLLSVLLIAVGLVAVAWWFMGSRDTLIPLGSYALVVPPEVTSVPENNWARSHRLEPDGGAVAARVRGRDDLLLENLVPASFEDHYLKGQYGAPGSEGLEPVRCEMRNRICSQRYRQHYKGQDLYGIYLVMVDATIAPMDELTRPELPVWGVSIDVWSFGQADEASVEDWTRVSEFLAELRQGMSQ